VLLHYFFALKLLHQVVRPGHGPDSHRRTPVSFKGVRRARPCTK
jgi:hypothetical protein